MANRVLCPNCFLINETPIKPPATRVKRKCNRCTYIYITECSKDYKHYTSYKAPCLNKNPKKHVHGLVLKMDSEGLFYKSCEYCGASEKARAVSPALIIGNELDKAVEEKEPEQTT